MSEKMELKEKKISKYFCFQNWLSRLIVLNLINTNKPLLDYWTSLVAFVSESNT